MRALATLFVVVPGLAYATPGPDSVAVLANSNSPESLALADLYLETRDVPARQLCLVDVPADEHTIALADYQSAVQGPFTQCLTDAGVVDRIEAVLLIRGLPIRVDVNGERASLAAVLGAWTSEFTNTGSPIVGAAPGRTIMCGNNPCLAAAFQNPFLNVEEAFEPAWTRETAGRTWRPLLVTMLHGRSFSDAEKLIASATTAENRPPVSSDFVFMEGSDAARGVLDAEFDGVIAELASAGVGATRVPFDRDWTGQSIAAFFVGTARLDTTIEGNVYAPGTLVDNLTSFGAAPRNFEPTGQSQVSIARWVAEGVAGVHGTTDEPLNNVFPSRRLIVDYIEGGTLAEAYHRRLPYVYWRNLVLGDPMAAPYAERPVVTIDAPSEINGAQTIAVRASHSRGIESLTLYADGLEVATSVDGAIDGCFTLPEGPTIDLLAVARADDDGGDAAWHKPKGWVRQTVDVQAGGSDCTSVDAGVDAGPTPDAGIEDSSDTGPPADAGANDVVLPDAHDAGGSAPDAGDKPVEAGCSCSAGPAQHRHVELAILVVLLVGRRRSSRKT